MAKVYGQVTGGSPKELNANTVAEVKKQMGYETYVASINGEPAKDEDTLEDFNVVTLSAPIKGGC